MQSRLTFGKEDVRCYTFVTVESPRLLTKTVFALVRVNANAVEQARRRTIANIFGNFFACFENNCATNQQDLESATRELLTKVNPPFSLERNDYKTREYKMGSFIQEQRCFL
jgi:hypothetical protein